MIFQDVPPLLIDPLLLVEAREVWTLIGKPGNPVWPGWDARKTPILIYFPGRQDVLINHPNPPAGFRRYTGPIRSPIGAIYVRDGSTTFDMDGQNTSTKIGGVETLVIADTLSTRRQWVKGLAGAVTEDAEKADATIEKSLFANPFDTMTMFAHEAFHVHQRNAAPEKHPDEMSLVEYPSLSVTNNVGNALEADRLVAALSSKTTGEVRKEALRWLAVRKARRAVLPASSVAYEDATEFSEGLAKYVEYRSLQLWEGKRPASEMWLVQGFRGYGNLAAERERLVRRMKGYMDGSSGVNNDLYGASPVRFRLYYSGMAVAALLDRLGAKWHDRIFRKEATLTGLVEEVLQPSGEDLAWNATPARQEELRTEKERLAAEGDAHVASEVAKFDSVPGELVIDYSALKDPKIGFGYTSFGILRVDADRNIFRLTPVLGSIDGFGFSESSARPVMHDRKEKRIHLQLTQAPAASLAIADTLNLPGVKLTGVKGRFLHEGRRVVLLLE
ncbi:hypothetical protein EON81_15340 [bacterium]|nr:MAG: hypothetical protein EON81_15340 [bacterium]